MRRVLFVVNVDWFFLSHRWPIAKALMADGVDVHLAASLTPEASSFLEAEGMTLHDLPFSRRGRSPLELVSLTRTLRRLQRSLRPDLVHNVTIKPVLASSVASRLGGRAHVVNAISGFGHLLSDEEAGRAARSVTLRAYRFALRAPHSTRVIFQNQEALRQFVDEGTVRRRDARLIPGSGVDVAAFTPPPAEPATPTVMLVGRMIRSKGIEEFLAASPLVKSRFPDAVRFVLVGGTDPGNPLSYDDTELHQRATAADVEYWGPTQDVPSVMRRSTIQVFPTYHEGLPKTLLEAAATGRVIVATDIPGCREVIRHGESGRLVPVRDAEALASEVVDLLGDGAKRAQLGRAARQAAVDNFSVEQVVCLHMDLYGELLA